MITDYLHRSADLVALHIPGPDQNRRSVRAGQIDFGLTIAKHVHMGWFVVIGVDDDAQPMRPIDRNHQKNLTQLVGLIKNISCIIFYDNQNINLKTRLNLKIG